MGRAAIRSKGFTVVELLVVIVVLSIIATIIIVSYGAVQDKTRQKKMETDIQTIVSAVRTARLNTGKNLTNITGSTYTASPCVGKPAGTDFAALPATDACIVQYKAALSNIAAAAGTTLGDIRDPWGRPYKIDENEGESGGCTKDSITVYALPHNGSTEYPGYPRNNVPLSGFSGCS